MTVKKNNVRTTRRTANRTTTAVFEGNNSNARGYIIIIIIILLLFYFFFWHKSIDRDFWPTRERVVHHRNDVVVVVARILLYARQRFSVRRWRVLLCSIKNNSNKKRWTDYFLPKEIISDDTSNQGDASRENPCREVILLYTYLLSSRWESQARFGQNAKGLNTFIACQNEKRFYV